VFEQFIKYYCHKFKRGWSGHVARSGRWERKNGQKFYPENINGRDDFRYMEIDELIILTFIINLKETGCEDVD
jgi:hypothetical protein